MTFFSNESERGRSWRCSLLTCMWAIVAICAVGCGPAEIETERWPKAIDRASMAGGGIVTIPQGRHITGTLFLKDYVTLRLEDITLRNVLVDVPGAGEAGERERGLPVPEKPDAYPESNMFERRMLPAYGFFIRHADGVRFDNVAIRVNGVDARPEIVTDDVSGFVRCRDN